MYTIYMHTNKINEKKYIGMTKQDLPSRWLNGQGYSTQSVFYDAIIDTGWDNFEHAILETDLSKDDAKERERYYIAFFDTTNPDLGYNQANGTGALNEAYLRRRAASNSSTIYQYDLDYNPIRSWESPRELKKHGYSDKAVFACCRGNIQTYGGYRWSRTPLVHPALTNNYHIRGLSIENEQLKLQLADKDAQLGSSLIPTDPNII